MRAREAERKASGSAFGGGADLDPDNFDPSALGLPKGFEKYLNK